MLPDRYIDHGSQTDQIEEAGLSPKHIASTAMSLVGGYTNSLHFFHSQMGSFPPNLYDIYAYKITIGPLAQGLMASVDLVGRCS